MNDKFHQNSLFDSTIFATIIAAVAKYPRQSSMYVFINMDRESIAWLSIPSEKPLETYSPRQNAVTQ